MCVCVCVCSWYLCVLFGYWLYFVKFTYMCACVCLRPHGRAHEYVCMCTRVFVMCVCGELGREGERGEADVVRAFVYIHVTMDVRIY